MKFRLSARIEVGRDVGMRAVDSRVDDADPDAAIARLHRVGAFGGRTDHPQVPLECRKRIRARDGCAGVAAHAGGLTIEVALLEGELVDAASLAVARGLRDKADPLVARDSLDRRAPARSRQEPRVRRACGGHADLEVLADDPAAGGPDGRAGVRRRDTQLVEDHVALAPRLLRSRPGRAQRGPGEHHQHRQDKCNQPPHLSLLPSGGCATRRQSPDAMCPRPPQPKPRASGQVHPAARGKGESRASGRWTDAMG